MEQDLQALVELCYTLEELAVYSDPKEADGHCGYATDVFLDVVEELLPGILCDEVMFVQDLSLRGCCGDVFSYQEAPHPWYLKGCGWPGHVVARVGDFCVDWTARQFDPEAPFPLIFRLPEA